MSGRKQWAVLAAVSCCMAASAADLSLPARRADFDELVTTVNEQYVYLDTQRAWWATVRGRYADRIAEAETADAWSALLEDALSELHDFHVGVRPWSSKAWLPVPTFADLWAVPDGERIRIVAVRAGSDAARAGMSVGDRVDEIDGVPAAAAISRRLGPAVDAQQAAAREWAVLSLVTGRRDEPRKFSVRTGNDAARTVVLPGQRRIDRPTAPVTWSRLPDGIGVIRFNNSLGEQAAVTAFDSALAELRDTRGLIVDLRDTPSGGTSAVALGILGRFVDTQQPYQRHRIPRYGRADVERNWLEEVAPRGPFTYRAPLVVLVDHWTGSMGEGMAIGFDAMRRATVAGTTMGRLNGANDDLTLSRTGVSVSFPSEELFHVDGTPRHRWIPPVATAEADGRSQSDAALELARKRLTDPALQSTDPPRRI